MFNKFIFFLKRLRVVFYLPIYVGRECGHRTKRKGAVSAFGQSTITRMPKNIDGTVDYCLDCIGNMAIKCAWCPNVIFIGAPVTLYSYVEDIPIPEGATVYDEKDRSCVGCLGWNCAETGADRAGFWNPGKDGKGCVQLVMSPLAQVLFGHKEGVIVENVGDIKEALRKN